MENDFEEGEILDSEEETADKVDNNEKEKPSEETTATEPEPEDPMNAYNVISRPSDSVNSTYRHRNTLNVESDDDDDDSSVQSDEDTDLWKLKKSKYFSNRGDKTEVKLSDVIMSPVRPDKNNKSEINSSSVRNIDFDKGVKRKKQNNVWGSVLTEQSLSQTMGSIGVERKEHVINSYRNVEAYDYLNAFDDERPFEEGTSENPEPMDPFSKVIGEDRGRKRDNKRGKRHHSKSYDRKNIKRQKRYRTCNPDDPDELVVNTIVENLQEEKPYLIEKIMSVIGKKKAIELMYETEDIEEEGGMKTNDGYRRRTPGGVYIQLIKQDPDITKEMVNEIFAEEQKKYQKELKKKQKERKKQKLKMAKMLPQSRFMSQPNAKPMTNSDEKKQCPDEDEMETVGENGCSENTGDTSIKSNDEDFLNRSEDQLDIMLGEEEAL